MKFLILSTVLAAAATQSFVGQPAQLVLLHDDNRAILQINQGDPSSQFQQGFDNSQGISGTSQGLGGSQQSFVSASQGSSGSVPGSFSSSQGPSSFSQSSSSQSSQDFGSSRPSPINSQTSFSDSQQGFISGQQASSSPQQGFSSSQQGFSSSQQTQGSGSPQFKSSSQLSSSNQGQEEVSGVFEPLNLPSGATLLLGDIDTSFSCIDQPYGYYADQQNSCRVFHICYPALFSNGRVETYQYSFMCGEGTRYDQKELTCVKESDAISCESSSEFYYRNGEFGLPEERANL